MHSLARERTIKAERFLITPTFPNVGYSLLGLGFTLKNDRYRTIILDLNEHMGAEYPFLHGNAQPSQVVDEMIDKRLGDLRRGGVDEAGAAPFARVGIQGELRYYEHFAAHILHG